MPETSLFERLWALAACDTLVVSTELTRADGASATTDDANGSPDRDAALCSPMRRLDALPRTTARAGVIDRPPVGPDTGWCRIVDEPDRLLPATAGRSSRDELRISVGTPGADVVMPNHQAAATVLDLLHTLRRGVQMHADGGRSDG